MVDFFFIFCDICGMCGDRAFSYVFFVGFVVRDFCWLIVVNSVFFFVCSFWRVCVLRCGLLV